MGKADLKTLGIVVFGGLLVVMLKNKVSGVRRITGA